MNNDELKDLDLLIIDPDASSSNLIMDKLDGIGAHTTLSSSLEDSISLIERGSFDIIVCDLDLRDPGQLEILNQFKRIRPSSQVLITGTNKDSDVAIQAIKHGAYDYIAKPYDHEELLLMLTKIRERERLRNENLELRKRLDNNTDFDSIITGNARMLELLANVKRLSSFDTTILITGESGTGKELIARALHRSSARSGAKFVAINCGAIPEHLIEAELFGYKAGAFTDATRDKKGLFEEANGGTIFLDEIGELPLHLQVKLLRVLQERKLRPLGSEQLIDLDVRLLAATHRNLEESVRDGKFREDLFYRLNVISIELPPLRNRIEDIELLAKHFLKKINKKCGFSFKGIADSVWPYLFAYNWPGNIRELENSIERAAIMGESDYIQESNLPSRIVDQLNSKTQLKQTNNPYNLDDRNLSVKEHSKNLEISLIEKALHKTKGNRTKAAKLLDISHRALLYKIKEYGIE